MIPIQLFYLSLMVSLIYQNLVLCPWQLLLQPLLLFALLFKISLDFFHSEVHGIQLLFMKVLIANLLPQLLLSLLEAFDFLLLVLIPQTKFPNFNLKKFVISHFKLLYSYDKISRVLIKKKLKTKYREKSNLLINQLSHTPKELFFRNLTLKSNITNPFESRSRSFIKIFHVLSSSDSEN